MSASCRVDQTYVANFAGWPPGYDSARRHVFPDERMGADECASPNSDARKKDGAGCDDGVVLDSDG